MCIRRINLAHTLRERLWPCCALVSLLTLGALSLNGCMPTSEVNFERYTLTQDVNPEVYKSKYLAEVKLTPILDQGGVVIQISDVVLRPAKNYRYSTSLAAELNILLLNEMMQSKLDPRYKITLYVTKFQGTLEGQVIVEALAQVTNSKNNRVLLTKAYTKSSLQTQDGYDSLVQALKQNYIALCRDLLQDLSAAQK